MKILFLTPRFPYPPLKGEQVRVYNFIKYLSRHGHKVTLLSICSKKDFINKKELEKYCEEIYCIKIGLFEKIFNFFKMIFLGLPLQNFSSYSSLIKNKITELKSKHEFDIVQIELIRMAQYIQEFKGFRIIVDLVDSLALNMKKRFKRERFWVKPIFYYEWKSMERYEKTITNLNCSFLVVSISEKKAISDSKKIEVVQNGVNVCGINNIVKTPNKIIFTGNLGYFPNVDAVLFFVKEVFPLIKAKMLDAKFFVVGANPAKKIKNLDNGVDIFVIGYVENIYEHIASASCAVAPMLSGTGIQNKILEAMACKVPVVATNCVLSGINCLPNKHILIADKPEEFANAVVSLLQKPEFNRELAKEAFDFVNSNFNWGDICKKLYKFI
ncbi:hypothetical protein A3J90_05825 [candidate division WOR-1 bacterium RIFOXYC2_FULL_37_10]|uniref:Glycosyltransferase subfamily 4-like N-terminal domain-containing protein n=1 Tax=candidate division WOR-1 bacterium RIFOXYB2_FULL_37_13 TaxID=1802579 RepID=A0A1F4SQ43_UNCSA|nr:MAG: hypothetical protein A2310_07240 [candidate division WOR-1 bacterium RIFOXYB2_FULL_37_13]OGC34904.1 MAG: hypothetical protein A3J90_05825 [candidate division WOR-1 bacterium RIFOXYC2_FULL_37_10]